MYASLAHFLANHKWNAARIAAGLGAMGAIISQAPDWKIADITIQNALIVVPLVIAWLICETRRDGVERQDVVEVKGVASVAHPSDLKLAKEFRDKFGSEVVDLLRDHDFLNGHHQSRSEAILHAADHWHGVDWEFHDDHLKPAFRKFLEDIRALADLIATEMGPHDQWANSRTVLLAPEMRGGEISDRTRAAAAALNNAARAAHGSYESMVRALRNYLPEAF